MWFLTNPVDGQVHINDDGKPSRRSHQNVTAWRYLLLESDRDDISEREWSTALSLLPLPIAAITETEAASPTPSSTSMPVVKPTGIRSRLS